MESLNADQSDSKDLSILPVHAEDSNQTEIVIEPYGPSGMFHTLLFWRHAYSWQGFRGIFSSRYVALCAAFSAIGGMLFGYEYVLLPSPIFTRLTGHEAKVLSLSF